MSHLSRHNVVHAETTGCWPTLNALNNSGKSILSHWYYKCLKIDLPLLLSAFSVGQQPVAETSNSVKNVRHPSSPSAVYRSLVWVTHACPKVFARGLRQPDIIAAKKQKKITLTALNMAFDRTSVRGLGINFECQALYLNFMASIVLSTYTATPSLEDYEQA